MLKIGPMLKKLYSMNGKELTSLLCKVMDESGIPYTVGEGQIEVCKMSMVCIRKREKSGGAVFADDGNGNSGNFGYAGGVEYEYIDTDTVSDADYAEFRRREQEDEETAAEFLHGCQRSSSFEKERYFPSLREELDP